MSGDVRSPCRSIDTHGRSCPVWLSRKPPQNVNELVNDAVILVGSRGSSQTHCRLRLALKLCTPTMANTSQKKLIRNATRTNNGVAFFRLLRMI
jgi:hypothetical protein